MPAFGRDLRRIVGTRAYDGTAGNGAVGAASIFTVTGEVLIALLTATCTETLAGATATISLGVTGDTAALIGATTATTITNGLAWHDATPKANLEAVPAALKDIWITDNILTQIAVADVTNGTLRFTLWWLPISNDANVVLAAGVT